MSANRFVSFAVIVFPALNSLSGEPLVPTQTTADLLEERPGLKAMAVGERLVALYGVPIASNGAELDTDEFVENFINDPANRNALGVDGVELEEIDSIVIRDGKFKVYTYVQKIEGLGLGRSLPHVELILEPGKVVEVHVTIGVEVGEAAAGACAPTRAAVDARAMIAKALVEEVIVEQIGAPVAVVVAAAVRGEDPEPHVIPAGGGVNLLAPDAPNEERVTVRVRALGSTRIAELGIDVPSEELVVEQLETIGVRDTRLNIDEYDWQKVAAPNAHQSIRESEMVVGRRSASRRKYRRCAAKVQYRAGRVRLGAELDEELPLTSEINKRLSIEVDLIRLVNEMDEPAVCKKAIYFCERDTLPAGFLWKSFSLISHDLGEHRKA